MKIENVFLDYFDQPIMNFLIDEMEKAIRKNEVEPGRVDRSKIFQEFQLLSSATTNAFISHYNYSSENDCFFVSVFFDVLIKAAWCSCISKNKAIDKKRDKMGRRRWGQFSREFPSMLEEMIVLGRNHSLNGKANEK